jgi:hypothetical protein
VSDQGRQPDGWFRYGVHFVDQTAADTDLIHDSIFSLVVPDLFSTMTQPSWLVQRWRDLRHRWLSRAPSRARRQTVRVPLRVSHPAGAFVVTARDLSTTGVSVTSPVAVPVGTEVALSMFVPARAWHGTVTVARVEARPSRPGFDTWILGLRFAAEQQEAVLEDFQQADAA